MQRKLPVKLSTFPIELEMLRRYFYQYLLAEDFPQLPAVQLSHIAVKALKNKAHRDFHLSEHLGYL